MKRALKDGVESLTDNEPFVVEVKDGLYKWHEGWNRMIALKRLCEQGKIPEIKEIKTKEKSKADKKINQQ